MAKRTYAIMGATGQIGHVVAEELLKRGHGVRALGRNKTKLSALEFKGAETRTVPFDDTSALTRTFEGVSAVFSMIPPEYGADDFGAYQDRTGEAIATALKQAKVAYVVNLSSIGAHLSEGTGPIKGLGRHEKRLNAIPGLNVVHFRPAYFMENQLWSIRTIKQHGINGSPLSGDLPIPMVVTRDIGAKAAELLDRLEFRSHTVVEFIGPRPVTLNETTAILGRAIGKPDLKYVQFPYAEAEKTMLGMGMKPSIVALMIEMQRSFNEGRVMPEGKPVSGKTTIEEFAGVFAKAYQSDEPARV